MTIQRHHFLLISPLSCCLIYLLLDYIGLDHSAAITAGIGVWIALWWISECMPIPVTSMLPFVLFPLVGVLDFKQVSLGWGSHVILLLMGGFMLARGLEKSGLHKRFAIMMLNLMGGHGGRRLVFAFMLVAAFLSMWISNTATTLMMMPIALAILVHSEDQTLKQATVLGIAYAASLGGVATLIGTPPNIIFAGVYEEVTGNTYHFMDWLSIGLPFVILGLPIMALWLTRNIHIKEQLQLPTLGRWQQAELRVCVIFASTVCLWITRTAPFGGWSTWFSIPLMGDATVALLGVMAMFLIGDGKNGKLLYWEDAVKIPWGILMLFAGGLTLARAFSASGLSTLIATQIEHFLLLPPLLLILMLCLLVNFLTELTSNTATTTLLMPILAAIAVGAGMEPAILMVAATISASCAFMLPVATAPNAIAYGTGLITTSQMAREGFVLNLMMVVLTAIICHVRLY